MTTTQTPTYRIEDARSALWFGRWPSGWGDVVHGVDPGEARTAAAMIDAAGLAWSVEQHPLEAVLDLGELGQGAANSGSPTADSRPQCPARGRVREH